MTHSHCLALFIHVLDRYAANTGEDLHTVLADLPIAVDPLTAATRVEDLAEATWQAVAERGADLPSSPSPYILARPFADGEARLIVLFQHDIVFNDVWITSGSLSEWKRCVNNLATALSHHTLALSS